MKICRIVAIVLCMLTLAAVSYGQSNAALLTQLTTVEKGLWEAWKNNNRAVFEARLRDDVVGVGVTGISGKAELLNNVSSKSELLSRLGNRSCSLQDYSLDDFKLTMLDKNVALLTFKGSYTCSGQSRRSGGFSAIFTNRGGKSASASDKVLPGNAFQEQARSQARVAAGWFNAFCQETSQ